MAFARMQPDLHQFSLLPGCLQQRNKEMLITTAMPGGFWSSAFTFPSSTACVILCIRRSVISMQISLVIVTLSYRVIDFLEPGLYRGFPSWGFYYVSSSIKCCPRNASKKQEFTREGVDTCVPSSAGPHTRIVMDTPGYWFKQDNKLILT